MKLTGKAEEDFREWFYSKDVSAEILRELEMNITTQALLKLVSQCNTGFM